MGVSFRSVLHGIIAILVLTLGAAVPRLNAGAQNATPPAQSQAAGTQAPQSSTPPANLPRVFLFATGGTISNKTGGRLTVEELIQSVPNLDRRVKAEGEQFSNVASGQVTMDQWLALSRKINERFRKDADLAGVVVTTGTDTLEEMAVFSSPYRQGSAPGGRGWLDAEPEHDRL
jgi:L-asparaginase